MRRVYPAVLPLGAVAGLPAGAVVRFAADNYTILAKFWHALTRAEQDEILARRRARRCG